MKKTICALCLSLLASAAQGQNLNFSQADLPGLNAAAIADTWVDIPSPVSDVESAGPRVTLLLNAAQADQREPAWPGYSVLSQPVMLYEAGVRSFLVGHPAPPAGYSQLLASPQAVFMKPGPVPGVNFTYYFDFPVNGAGTFVLRYDSSRDPADDVRTAVHELFHAYQHSAFKRVFAPRRDSEPDAEDLALAALEQKILKDGITAGGSAARARAARQFLAVRQARYLRLPDVQGQEDMEERSEGTALYADHVIMDRPAVAPVAGGIIPKIALRLERLPDVSDMDKSRYYATGAAQALLLDHAEGQVWKARVAAGSSLRDQLALAYPLSGASALLLAEARLKYDYRQLLREAGKKVTAYQAAKAAALAEYANSPGLEWSVPATRTVSYSAQGPNYKLGDSETLMPKVFLLDASEEGFSLVLRDRPVIRVLRDIRFRCAAPSVLLDGRPFTPAEGTHEFAALSVTAAGVTLSVSKPGRLTVAGGRAQVAYR